MADQSTPHDPFALQPLRLHPAISGGYEVNKTIDSRLFEGFFQTPEFTSWATGTKPWQLHCFGGPGCGKTELAAATAQRLHKIHGNTISVPAIFITDDIISPSLIFIEDFLRCINDQLRSKSFIASPVYESACMSGQPVKDRIAAVECDIGKRLRSTCTPTTHAFLIVDGYDRINEGLQITIERSLTGFHQHGLRTFLTRRVPAFEVAVNAVCDGCRKENMNMYWVCSECQKKNTASWYWLCYSCRDSGRLCTNCTEETFVENKLYVNVPLRIDGSALIEYLSSQLECEFGTVEPEVCERITNYIVEKSGGNVTLARLYLENILTTETLDSFDPERVSDRLPSNVIAFFDTELYDITALPEELRKIAFLSIAATAKEDYGLPLEDLEKQLRPHVASIRSVEEVLDTAKGWLIQQSTKAREIVPFSPIFALYAGEDYNESFSHARILLEASTPQLHEIKENETLATVEANLELAQPDVPPNLLAATANFVSDSSISTIESTPSIGTSIDTLSTRQTSYQSIGHSVSQQSDRGLIQITEEGHFRSPSRMDTGEMLDSPYSLDTPIAKLQSELLARKFTAGVTPRICGYCRDNVLGAGKVFGEHFSSLADAMNTKRCIFCDSLYGSISGRKVAENQWPLYKWTIRNSVQGRAGKRCIILTFRPANEGIQHLPSKRFHFFAESDINTATLSSLGDSTNLATTGQQIKNWIQICNQHHPHCYKPSKASFVPTRLLDLQSPNPNMFRIVNTKYTPIKESYCTLSHSWGRSEFIQTTASNIEKHTLEGIHISSLPRNFREAIEVVQLLGIRYIWIDSLCIVQGKSGDFNIEGGLMHAVYRNSYCNIVAADSDGAEGGLFRIRKSDSILAVSHTVCESNMIFGKAGKEWKIIPGDLWENDLLRQSFIYSRGWVFQERMLSPRLLHFAHGQIFWDCASISACEVLPSGLPTPLDTISATDRHWRGRLALDPSSGHLSGPIDNESPYTFWEAAVQNYTSCNLTNNNDKCLAIWSVAKILRDILHEEYTTGMWAKHLVEQLAWKVHDCAKSRRSADLQLGNPSWAWTSMDGRIVPQHRIAERVYQVSDHGGSVVGFKAMDGEGGRDQMPILTSKSLPIMGYVQSGHVKKNSHRESGYELSTRINDDREFAFDAFPDEDPGIVPELYLDCEFVILAASTTMSDDDDEEGFSEMVGEYEDDIGEESDDSDGDDEHETDAGNGNEPNIEDENKDDEAPVSLPADDSCPSPPGAIDLELLPQFSSSPESYYGIGLLLISYNRWLELQQRRLPVLQREHDILKQQDDHSTCHNWACNLRKELDGLQKLLEVEGKSDKEGKLHYRRVGMIKFNEMDKGLWTAIQRGVPLEFWLD